MASRGSNPESEQTEMDPAMVFGPALKIVGEIYEQIQTSLENDKTTKHLLSFCQRTAESLQLLEERTNSSNEVIEVLSNSSDGIKKHYEKFYKEAVSEEEITPVAEKDPVVAVQRPSHDGKPPKKLSGRDTILSGESNKDNDKTTEEEEDEGVQGPPSDQGPNYGGNSSAKFLHEKLVETKKNVEKYIKEKEFCWGLIPFLRARHWKKLFKNKQESIREAIMGLSLNLNAQQFKHLRSMRVDFLSNVAVVAGLVNNNGEFIQDILESVHKVEKLLVRKEASIDLDEFSSIHGRTQFHMKMADHHQSSPFAAGYQQSSDTQLDIEKLFPRTVKILGREIFNKNVERVKKGTFKF